MAAAPAPAPVAAPVPPPPPPPTPRGSQLPAPAAVWNRSFTDRVLRDRMAWACDKSFFGRFGTALSLVPMVFDTVINLVIDSLGFAVDSTVGVYSLATGRWRQKTSDLKGLSFGRFVSFCSSHFAFSTGCLNAVAQGVVVSWAMPKYYLGLLPSTREVRAANHLQPEDVYYSSFKYCAEQYAAATTGRALPPHSTWRARGLKIVVDSLARLFLNRPQLVSVSSSDRDEMDTQIARLNTFIKELPDEPLNGCLEVGQLVNALYALPGYLTIRIDFKPLHGKISVAAAVAAADQFLLQQTRRYCPPAQQVAEFKAFYTFLESLYSDDMAGKVVKNQIKAQLLSRAWSFCGKRPLLAVHMATEFKAITPKVAAKIQAYCAEVDEVKQVRPDLDNIAAKDVKGLAKTPLMLTWVLESAGVRTLPDVATMDAFRTYLTEGFADVSVKSLSSRESERVVKALLRFNVNARRQLGAGVDANLKLLNDAVFAKCHRSYNKFSDAMIFGCLSELRDSLPPGNAIRRETAVRVSTVYKEVNAIWAAAVALGIPLGSSTKNLMLEFDLQMLLHPDTEFTRGKGMWEDGLEIRLPGYLQIRGSRSYQLFSEAVFLKLSAGKILFIYPPIKELLTTYVRNQTELDALGRIMYTYEGSTYDDERPLAQWIEGKNLEAGTEGDEQKLLSYLLARASLFFRQLTEPTGWTESYRRDLVRWAQIYINYVRKDPPKTKTLLVAYLEEQFNGIKADSQKRALLLEALNEWSRLADAGSGLTAKEQAEWKQPIVYNSRSWNALGVLTIHLLTS